MAVNNSIPELSIGILNSEQKKIPNESPKTSTEINSDDISNKKSPQMKVTSSSKKQSFVFFINSSPEISHHYKKEDCASLSSNFSPNLSPEKERFNNSQSQLQLNLVMIKEPTEKCIIDDYNNKSGISTNLTSQREIYDSNFKSSQYLNQISPKSFLKLPKVNSIEVK